MVLGSLLLLGAFACSAGTITSTNGDGGTSASPSPTATGTGTSTGTTEPPPSSDAGTPNPIDAAPPIDKTPRFDLTLDGDPVPIANVTAKIVPASGSTPARINVAGQYEQQLPQGFTSTATFTVIVDATATGTDACGVNGRDATYLFKDTDGAIRGESAGLQGGSCTMKVFSNAGDGFSSGSATGVIGGVTQKSFTIAWGHAL